MNLSQLEKNLLVFLDPVCRWHEDDWLFIRPGCPAEDADQHKNRVFCFPRRSLPEYLWCYLTVRFRYRTKGKKVRSVLYLNDGLLSSVFETTNRSGYRAFSRNHLPRPHGVRGWLSGVISPFWRAEQRFVVIEKNTTDQTDELGRIDYLFFSNPEGKLMLARSDTFHSGTGRIFKTTAVHEYATSLHHELSTIRSIAQRLPDRRLLQGPEELQVIRERPYFSEAYLYGKNLREVLRVWGGAGACSSVCLMLDRLDTWFSAYRSAFSGNRSGLSVLYEQKLQIFSDSNSGDPESRSLLQHIRKLLSQLDLHHGGVVPVTAHNDLWPGNFIVQGEHLAAIDWERATEQSSPLFDYFWMIISATLEYLVGNNGVQDYSTAFRQFLTRKETVCCHAYHKLENFLDQLEFNRSLIHQFMLFFLMEWSIQGFQALGRVTDMDRLAKGELAAFINNTIAVQYQSP